MIVRHLGFTLLAIFLVITSPKARAATSDYAKLAYIDQTLLIGLGLSFTKMETYIMRQVLP